MPFPIPSLLSLVQRSRGAFRSYLPGSDAWLWPNNLNPVAKVLGGMSFELFGFADYIQKQKFAITADGENLALHGAEGLAKKPAQPSTGNIIVTSRSDIVIAAGAQLVRSDGMQIIAQQSAGLAGAGTLTIAVETASGGQNTITIATRRCWVLPATRRPRRPSRWTPTA